MVGFYVLRKLKARTFGCFPVFNNMKIVQGTAGYLKWIFCREFGILERDIGIGYYTTKSNLFGDPNNKITGICVYDATSGSLRLTKLFDTIL